MPTPQNAPYKKAQRLTSSASGYLHISKTWRTVPGHQGVGNQFLMDPGVTFVYPENAAAKAAEREGRQAQRKTRPARMKGYFAARRDRKRWTYATPSEVA